jgi:hypothetical protein
LLTEYKEPGVSCFGISLLFLERVSIWNTHLTPRFPHLSSTMSAISSLLNPSKDSGEDRTLPSPSMSAVSLGPTATTPASLTSPPLKKQRLAKDAAVFTQGKVRGEIRYPPFEDYDAGLREELEKFAVHPLGNIGQFRRHIPYNSDKKDFMEKTGRDAFEGEYETHSRGNS